MDYIRLFKSNKKYNYKLRIILISKARINTYSSSLKEFSPIVRVESNKSGLENSIKNIK